MGEYNKMTNQFMQDGITYMINKAYQRGLKHSLAVMICAVMIASFVSFMGGRAYAYYQGIEDAAKVVEKFKIN